MLKSDRWLSLTSQLTSQDVLASAPLTFTLKSLHLSRCAFKCTSDFYSQISHLSRHACKCTFNFHSEVTSPLKHVLANALLNFTHCQVTSQDVLASALLTFTHKSLCCWHRPIRDRLATVAHFSFHVAVILLLWASYFQLVPRVLCVERPLLAGFASGSICSDTVTCLFGQCRTLLFPIHGAVSHSRYCHKVPHRVALDAFLSCLWCKLLLYWARPCYKCHLIKINHVLFPLTVLRLLSFLIPSFTKINMSSYPVVCLPLTFAWGLLGACHRDSSLAVLFPLWLERLETLLEVAPSLSEKLKWLHHLSGLWSPLLCCKQIGNYHKTKCYLAALSHACRKDPTCMTNW